MKPLILPEVYDRIVSANVLKDLDPAVPMVVADAFEELTKTDRKLTDEEKRLLFEVSLLLTVENYRQKREAAISVLLELQVKYRKFEFRPAPPTDPVEPAADEVAA